MLEKRKVSEYLVVLIVLAISIAAHSINMLNFPYFENDEGTYMSQAWSVLRSGDLAPYKYNFDHAPLGWIFTSIWVLLTGGFYAFGFSLNSGRVFIAVLHALSTLFLYYVTKRLTGSRLTAIFSVLFFSLSPLAIYFQRRLLLDNILVFWLLLSVYLLTFNVKNLNILFLSALTLCIAVLTKESAFLFLPPLMYLIYARRNEYSVNLTDQEQYLDKIKYPFIYLLIFMLLFSLYPLLAYFNGSLMPSQSGSNLIDAISNQLSRTSENSLISMVFRNWVKDDPFLIFLSIASLIVNLILAKSNQTSRILIILTIPYVLFIASRKLIFDFYLIPLIPFLAISISYAAIYIYKVIKNKIWKNAIITLLVLSLILMISVYSRNINEGYNLFKSNQTQPQKESVAWIIDNQPDGTLAIIDNYAFIELNDSTRHTNSRFDYYWKAGTDPDIMDYHKSFNDGKMRLILLTEQMQRDFNDSESLKNFETKRKNLMLIKTFQRDGWKVDILSN